MNVKNMRILIVIHKAKKKGGMVLQHLKMAKEFKVMGHEVLIFSFDNYFTSKNILANYLSMFKNLKLKIERFKPSVILTSDPYFTTFFTLLAKRKSIPICLRMGAIYHLFYSARFISKISSEKMYIPLFYFINFIIKQFGKIILKKLNLVIFNSKYLENYYSRFTPNSVVIYNGVDTIRKSKVNVNKPLKLIYVGRIEPRKSIEIIIHALGILQQKDINFQFSIVGNINHYPKYWSKLSDLINKYKLNNKIIIHNEIDNNFIPSLLQKQDILLFSTDASNFPITEGLPNVILEGMANGLVIIATSVAGVPEIVNEDNGLLVKPNSKDIAKSIINLHQNKKLMLQIKENNIKKIQKNHTIQKIAENYLLHFEEIINERM